MQIEVEAECKARREGYWRSCRHAAVSSHGTLASVLDGAFKFSDMGGCMDRI